MTWLEIAIVAGIWGLLAAISLARMFTSPCCSPAGYEDAMLRATSMLSYRSLWFLLTVPVFWACRRLRPERLGWGRTLAGHLALALGVVTVVGLTSDYIQYGLQTVWADPEPIGTFSSHLTQFFTNLVFLGGIAPYVLLLALGLGRDAYLRYRERHTQAEKLERETEQLRARLTSARLETLRMQINPHFLYNTLHTVSTMAGRDPEGIRNATARLSEMLRYALSTSERREVPLEKELVFLNSYLYIQKLRLDDRLTVNLDIEPVARQALVPPLLLQPLAENAVKHGFEGADDVRRLDVRARRENDRLVIEVADDGAGIVDASVLPDTTRPRGREVLEQEGLGLQNIAERLQALYGDDASLDFEDADGGGLCVVIRLPFHTDKTGRDYRVSARLAK